MDVYFEDGRVAEFDGEIIYRGFAADKDSLEVWKVPEGEPITESEKQEIIEAVLEEAKTLPTEIVIE